MTLSVFTPWADFRQWIIVTDMNHDGRITISDAWLWFKWLYFYPGDVLVALIGPTAFGQFLEMSPDSFGGVGSFAVSFLVWFFVALFVGAVIADASERRRVKREQRMEQDRKRRRAAAGYDQST